MKLSDVAEKLSCRLEGDPSVEITGISGMDHATPGQITFLANRRYFPLLHTTRAAAIFIEEGIHTRCWTGRVEARINLYELFLPIGEAELRPETELLAVRRSQTIPGY